MSRRHIRCYARDTDQGDGCSEVANCAVNVDSAEKYHRRHGRETVRDNSGMLVIDIRTPREFTWGHIDAAENIDYDSSDFRWTLCAVDKDRPYIITAPRRVQHEGAGGVCGAGFKRIHHL